MLSRWQSTIVDAQGNVQPGAVLTIRNELDQSLAQVYMSPSDQQPYPLGQVPADATGYAYFYAPGGLYRIQSVALGIDWREVQIGAALVSIGDYGPGLEITARNQIFWRDGELYRAGAALELPYTTTGDWGVEEGLFVAVGDQALRQDLANPAKGASMVARGVVAVDSIADLLLQRQEEDKRYIVKGYYPGSNAGGMAFYWHPSRLKSEHNGGTIISPTVPFGGADGLGDYIDAVGETDPDGSGCFVAETPDILYTLSFGTGGGASASSQRKAVQACFNYAKDTNIRSVCIAGNGSEITIDHVGIRYEVSNSVLTYLDPIKLSDGGVKCFDVVSYSARSVYVLNQMIDGDRDQNVIDGEGRGTQFNFSCYGEGPYWFIGGYSRNAAQSHCSNTAEGLTLKGMVASVSGEHGFYLTLNEGVPRERVRVVDCDISDWNIDDWGAYAVSCRDYRDAVIEGGKHDPGATGYGYVQFFGEYRSTLPEGVRQKHIVRNVELKNGPNVGQMVIQTSKAAGSRCEVQKCGLKNMLGASNTIDLMVDCEIDLSAITNEFLTISNLPKILKECRIVTGANQVRPSSSFVIEGGEISKGLEPRAGTFIDISQGSVTGPISISGVKVKGFDLLTTIGIIRTKVGTRTKISDLEFYDCPNRVVRSVSAADIITGNADMTQSGSKIYVENNNALVSNNAAIIEL